MQQQAKEGVIELEEQRAHTTKLADLAYCGQTPLLSYNTAATSRATSFFYVIYTLPFICCMSYLLQHCPYKHLQQ